MDHLLTALAAIEAATRLDDYRSVISAVRGAMGYDAFAYAGLVPMETSHGRPVYLADGLLALMDYDGGWVAHYGAHGYHRRDPVIRAAMSQTLPVAWTADFMAGRRSTEEDAVMRDAAAWGVIRGLTVVVRSTDGTIGLLSFHGGGESQPAPSPRDVVTFHQVAIHLHDALRRRLRPEQMPPPLSPRELDVLMWSAEGKTAAEIADILGLSPRTVNAHLGSAMRKLGVYSKTHAVAKFLTGGW